MARWLAAALPFPSAAAASAELVTDGFETETLGPRGNPGYHTGPLGYLDDSPDVDFRFGPYRDRMATPMVIYFDDYRKERLAP